MTASSHTEQTPKPFGAAPHTAGCSVTCVVVAHREGFSAHTALASAAKARVFAEQRGLCVELALILNDCDELTKNIIAAHPALAAKDIVKEIRGKGLGAALNLGLATASGEFVIFANGENLLSEDFIFAAVEEARKGRKIVVHPEYVFHFGAEHCCARTEPLGPCAMFSAPFYGAVFAARRDFCAALPFAQRRPGFSFEYEHWFCEATAAGCEHRTAPGTVSFRRITSEALQRREQTGAIMPPSSFFTSLPKPENGPRSAEESRVPAAPVPWKACAKGLAFTLLRSLPASWGNRLYDALGNLKQRLPKRGNQFPPELRTALGKAAELDGLLHPASLPPVRNMRALPDAAPGKAYAEAWSRLHRHDYDIVYTAPHIGAGGADLMTVNYARAAAESGRRVLCVSTGGRGVLPGVLPAGTDLLPLGGIVAHLPHADRLAVLARLLVQLASPITHMVNDWLGFQCLLRYGEALRDKSRLFASIFADAQDDAGIHHGAGTVFLRDICPYVEKVVTDNAATPADWVRRLGLPKNFFHPIYGLAPAFTGSAEPAHGNRVLWAGRLDAEKRLDIAYEIAKKLPEIQFDFYGGRVLDKTPHPAIKALSALPNARLLGTYSGFASLPTDRYFAFLYTTQCDGLPNVLLEAAAAGLPLVAPDRGGIRDFVTNDTGHLIPNHTDIAAYTAALREVQANPAEARERCARAKSLLAARHGKEAFAAGLASLYGK